MTREEEIKYASKDYVNYLLDKQEYHNENYTEDDIRQAFEKCAKWADKNPKSPWISVEDDLPCNHEELINTEYDKETVYVVVIGKDEIADTDCMEYNGKEWVWQKNSFFEPTHWFPISKLPKIS